MCGVREVTNVTVTIRQRRTLAEFLKQSRISSRRTACGAHGHRACHRMSPSQEPARSIAFACVTRMRIKGGCLVRLPASRRQSPVSHRHPLRASR